MKKILATALALTLTFGTFALPAAESGVCIADKFAVSAGAESYDDNDEYRYGEFDYEDFQYDILDDGTIEIKKYTGSNGAVDIPSTIDGKAVTSIGNDAFQYCEILSITIPNSITNISISAFAYCTNLKSITIPDSVTSIGDFAFYNCENLTSIEFSNGVTSIGYCAFSYCNGLTSVTIPDSVTNLVGETFSYCENLTSVSLPNSITCIPYGMFYRCKSLPSIIIPDTITEITDTAFYMCNNLKSITIPASVEEIGATAFQRCDNFESIIVDSNNKNYSSKDGILFNKDQTEIVKYPQGISKTSYKIPNSVKSIASSSFNYCDNLTSLIIPSSVKKMDHLAFYHTYLTDIFYAGSREDWDNFIKENNAKSTFDANIHYNSTGDTRKLISSCTITLPTTTQYFRGKYIKPVVTVKDETSTLKSGTDYTVSYKNNLSAGTATVTITGKGNYKGTATKTFNIARRFIGNCDIKLDTDSCYFSGTRIRPSVKLNCNGTDVDNKNYTLTYSNNLSAGTATITLKGYGDLTGTVKKSFKIKPRDLADCTVELTKNADNEYQPTVAVKIGSTSIYNGNYTVTYTTSADKKTVKVTITGKKNLTGSVTKTYTVQ